MINIDSYLQKLERLKEYLRLRIDGKIQRVQQCKKVSENMEIYYNAPQSFAQWLGEEAIRFVTPTGHVWENGQWIK